MSGFRLDHPPAERRHAAPGEQHTRYQIEASAGVVRQLFAEAPSVAIVLGTGLGTLARAIDVKASMSYTEIPGFPLATTESHAGRLLFGTLGGKTVVAMQGRLHLYEGYNARQVSFPVRVMRALGAETLVVSNACGGMNPLWNPGEIMLIADHINLLNDNPLTGPNDDELGPRFPDMSNAYDAGLRAMARAVATEEKIVLREGVYAAVAGPNLETRAEYRFLRTIGADVVGMSTVPEVIVAVHGGMKVLGLSIITDRCLPDALEPATVEQIISVASAAEPALATLVRGVVERL